MEDKPYGKYTLEQFKQFTSLLKESRNMIPEFETIFQENKNQIKSIFGEEISWVHFYEMPFDYHILHCVYILGWEDEIKAAAKSDDPQQHFLDFMNKLDKNDENWDGGYKGQYKKHQLLEIVISVFRTMKSIMIYQKSLSILVEEAQQGKDKSLFDAIRIDRTIVTSVLVNLIRTL